MNTFARFLGVLCAAVTLAACSGSSGPSKTTPNPAVQRLPKCQYPPKVTRPAWVPSDLPLPDGTYTTQTLPGTFGYQRAIFVIPGTAESFARYVIKEWPKSGWVLGRGDAEPGEVEDQFLRPPAVGAFRTRTEFCNPGYSLMLMIYSKDRTAVPLPSPTPRGVPLTPAPSPSPPS
jgi:hypothetical protein